MHSYPAGISAPVLGLSGEYMGMLCVLDERPGIAANVDITVLPVLQLLADLVALQRDANMDKAGRAEQTQEQLIAMLGHDLRGPLQAIITGTEVLQHRALDRSSKLVVERISRSAGRMARLIDNLLHLTRSKLAGGIIADRCKTTSLKRELEHVIDELQTCCPAPEIQFRWDVDSAVCCDTTLIAQLLSNLVENALKHGAPDFPVLVHAFHRAGTFTLSVTNQGTAIPASLVPQLFHPYWRADAGTTRGGVGLGLYIVSEIAAAHGGSVQVSSSAEAGTTFTVSLPDG